MKKINSILLLVLLIHLLLLIHLRFTAWLEMTLWPYLILQGWLPYRDIAIAHNPLLIFDLAIFFKIFGFSLLNLKIYTWLLILLTDLLVYWIAKKLTKNEKIALASTAFYVLWQPFFEGNGLWFDLALAPVGLLIFYLLSEKEFFWSGIFFGLAILIKQTAVWFAFPIILTFFFLKQVNPKPSFRFLLGVAIPVFILTIYLAATKTVQDFYFWTVKFGTFYLPKAGGQVELPTIKQILALGTPYALILPAILTLIRYRNVVKEWRLVFLLLIWCLFASLGAYPRWSLFHFQPALPFLAILSGIFISYINISYKEAGKWWVVFMLVVIIGTIYFQARFYWLNWGKSPRFFEKETIQMADWLKADTKPGEKVFILNSWDHLYALSSTLPAVRPWVPTLPWYMEYPGIQEKIVADLKREGPRLVVFEPYKQEGLGSYKPEKIDKFLRENYKLEELIAGRFMILIKK